MHDASVLFNRLALACCVVACVFEDEYTGSKPAVALHRAEVLPIIYMATGDLEPQQHRNGPQRMLTDFEELTLVNLVLTRPGIYLYELQLELLMTTGTEVDCSTICHLFKA